MIRITMRSLIQELLHQLDQDKDRKDTRKMTIIVTSWQCSRRRTTVLPKLVHFSRQWRPKLLIMFTMRHHEAALSQETSCKDSMGRFAKVNRLTTIKKILTTRWALSIKMGILTVCPLDLKIIKRLMIEAKVDQQQHQEVVQDQYLKLN